MTDQSNDRTTVFLCRMTTGSRIIAAADGRTRRRAAEHRSGAENLASKTPTKKPRGFAK